MSEHKWSAHEVDEFRDQAAALCGIPRHILFREPAPVDGIGLAPVALVDGPREGFIYVRCKPEPVNTMVFRACLFCDAVLNVGEDHWCPSLDMLIEVR